MIEESPKKITWVLLRGWTREQRHWREFPELLGQTSQGAVIGVDLPGAGTEHTRPSPLSISEIMEDVRSRFKPNTSQTKYVVVGISMGGMVALDWAAKYPKEFSAIVLINSSLASLSPFWQRLNLKNLPEMLRLLGVKSVEEMESGILNLTSSLAPDAVKKIAPEFAAIALESPVKRSTLLRQLVAAMKFSPHSWPDCPSLVISSQGDRLVHPRCSRALSSQLGSKLLIHPSAGHDLPLDDPKWLSLELTKWSGEISV